MSAASYEEERQVQLTLEPELRDALREAFGFLVIGTPARLRGGEESANWRTQTDAGDVVVRISPAWRSRDEVRWVHELIVFASQEIPEAVCPLRTKTGDSFIERKGHCVSVFPFVEGRLVDETEGEQLVAAAALLARVHSRIQTWPQRTKRPESSGEAPLTWRPQHKPPELEDLSLDAWFEGLARAGEPRGLIHGDFYHHNVLWDGSRISGLLDWDEAQMDYTAQEIAWAMWEFSELDRDRASMFVDAYRDAGGVIPTSFEMNAVNFVRMRLRFEMLTALAARERGEAFDEGYYDDELEAFGDLRGVTWSSSS